MGDKNSEVPAFDNMEMDKEKFIEFLKYPQNKRHIVEFLEKTYKHLEREQIERAINRLMHEHECELEGATPYYKPGHIGSLMYQYLNMTGVEHAYASSLQHTKASITKTVQQKVNEINTLLRGVGGFNRQIKTSFSRNAVLYLEQDDPRYNQRDRVVFTVNLANFELKNPVSEDAEEQLLDDGRTLRRVSWDDAVNTLSEIVSNTGLKPKYVRNDKNSCFLSMKQDLLHKNCKQPDEYFEFTLRYVSENEKAGLLEEYRRTIENYHSQIADLKREQNKFMLNKTRKNMIEEKVGILESDLEFYQATTPNPEEMDAGLVFSIYVNSLKDYGVTKDKMQYIMTKFILGASNIAVEKSMDQQLNSDFNNVKDICQHLEKGKVAVVKVDKKAS